MGFLRHTCPRCRNTIIFEKKVNIKELQDVRYCPVCWVPYKLNIDKKSQILSAVRCDEVQEIVQITSFGTIREEIMPDDFFHSFSRAANVIESAYQQDRDSLASLIRAASGDSASVMYWDPRIERRAECTLEQAVPLVVHLYGDYPFQVSMMLKNRELGTLIGAMSYICPNCRLHNPKSAQKCMYCKTRVKSADANTGKNISEQNPLKILKFRLAKGEITAAQYEHLKKALAE
jgi:hypothetical protein